MAGPDQVDPCGQDAIVGDSPVGAAVQELADLLGQPGPPGGGQRGVPALRGAQELCGQQLRVGRVQERHCGGVGGTGGACGPEQRCAPEAAEPDPPAFEDRGTELVEDLDQGERHRAAQERQAEKAGQPGQQVQAARRLDIPSAEGQGKAEVVIPPPLVPQLREQRAAQVAERLAAGEAWDDWDLVWCQPNGRPVDPHDDWEEWKGLLRDANVAKNLASTTLATQPPRSSLSKA